MKIDEVADAAERKRLAAILSEFVTRSSSEADTAWLEEISRIGVPVYGTRADSGDEIQRLNSAQVVPHAGVDAAQS